MNYIFDRVSLQIDQTILVHFDEYGLKIKHLVMGVILGILTAIIIITVMSIDFSHLNPIGNYHTKGIAKVEALAKRDILQNVIDPHQVQFGKIRYRKSGGYIRLDVPVKFTDNKISQSYSKSNVTMWFKKAPNSNKFVVAEKYVNY